MYEELVDEFEMKKNAGDDLAKKDIKVKELQSELNHFKQYVATKETLISGFQRELGNIATSALAGKELDDDSLLTPY